MEIPSIFIGLVLFAAALAYISLPFRQKRMMHANSSATSLQQQGQGEAILSALRDLDFDFKTGKISEEDYTPLRTHLVVEVAQYIEAEEKREQELEALIQTRRTAQQHDSKCQRCEAPIQVGERFCSKCGSAINSEACPSCGKNIQAGDLFCTSCGTKLEVWLETVVPS
jgi:predicted nucleic acid-binding Zn ribbon protein